MAVFQLIKEQKIPASIEEVWEFISSPDNLKKITPSYMGFEITSKTPKGTMYPGMIISYKVRPILSLPMTWVTEITHVKKYEYFVDEQRKGPYKMWHHEHHLKPIEGGVLMTDIISYEPPFGFLGSLANHILIKKQLNEIFEFRRKEVYKLFGSF